MRAAATPGEEKPRPAVLSTGDFAARSFPIPLHFTSTPRPHHVLHLKVHPNLSLSLPFLSAPAAAVVLALGRGRGAAVLLAVRPEDPVPRLRLDEGREVDVDARETDGAEDNLGQAVLLPRLDGEAEVDDDVAAQRMRREKKRAGGGVFGRKVRGRPREPPFFS
jgi:hypothetical protein